MRQVRTCGIMWKKLEYIKCTTGPDLWIFWEKTFIFKYQKCDRSWPVELREKMLEYIKCATGPDLWIFWEKPFISKYQKVWQVRTCGITWKIARIYKICHRSGPVNILRKNLFLNIKSATGPDLWNYVKKC